ncbi:MAG: 50S ribosomal protein L17 [Deltaproteobacteria bacterium]|nr:50S ribosomal protein L17 [Deltaproteobacteria bacterium]
MRHQKTGRRLGRNSSHRKAMYRNMVTSLFKYGVLETTDAKAKELKPIAEKLITLAKKGDLHSRRLALTYMSEKSITHKLFDEIKNRYLNRQGGYLRVVKNGFRRGDGAAVSIVQLLTADEMAKEAVKKNITAEEAPK